MIPVTKPFSPPIEEYQRLIEGIWNRNWFTNNGPLVQQLEQELKDYLRVSNLLYVSNGTIALQIAIKALGLTKEIITTPFSYVATTSSIVWEGCTPVFVDIDPNTLNIDPTKIEDAITDETEAILATHCFGNPCDIDAIDVIAKKYNLKVIYDAAHCFGVKYKEKSIFNYGDVSTLSTHATKIFHTVEGGATFTNSSEINRKMTQMRSFGHDGPYNFTGIGINGKNSELHATMGVINLRYIDEILNKRKSICMNYDELLTNSVSTKQELNQFCTWNYSYYPRIFPTEKSLLKVLKALNDAEVYPRRYFYPDLTALDYVKGNSPIASDISKRILCLPLYDGLQFQDLCKITSIILNNER